MEDEFCIVENYEPNIRNRLKKYLVYPEKPFQEDFACPIPIAEFDEIFMRDSKVVCLTKIDCILTQHYLDYLNLTKDIDKIFFIQNDK